MTESEMLNRCHEQGIPILPEAEHLQAEDDMQLLADWLDVIFSARVATWCIAALVAIAAVGGVIGWMGV